MRKKLFKSALGTIACVGLLAGNANALLLDFTDGSKSSLFEGTQSSVFMDYGNFTVTLTSFLNGSEGGDLTFNGHEGPGEIQIGSQKFSGDGDGIGIGNDEISDGQMLEVAFDPSVKVNEIFFLDLFNSGNDTEEAIVKYNLLSQTWETSVDDNSPFSVYGGISFGYSNLPNVLTIELTTAEDNGISDFSLAGIDVAPVPEPATMLLFGTGLAGIASLRRKMKK